MELIKLENISKSFPGVKALDNISFGIEEGKISGLVGENGAGKSTLMNILAGVYKPDNGKIILGEKELIINSEMQAQQEGIGIVFQETSLVENLNILENIFAGRHIVNRFGIINKRRMVSEAKILLEQVGVKRDPLINLNELTSVEKQLVEIAKALSLKPKLLILDEPTATISEREYKHIFSMFRKLKSNGISIIYISHRIQEIFEICDNVSVLKDGVYQGTKKVSETSSGEIIKMMVGREVLDKYDDREYEKSESRVVLEVKNLSSTKFRNINFILKEREILGISGLIGAGRTELALALFGLDQKANGEIYIKGKKVNFKSPINAIKAGVGYLTEDRKEMGVFLGLDIMDNIISANFDKVSRFGIVNDNKIKNITNNYIKLLKILTPSLKQKALNLSGGNQQKLLLSRWLLRNPEILIIDEPTRGIDVGVKSEIHKLIRSMAKEGKSIIVISSEIIETLALCDRIIVMWQGTKTGELLHDEATESKIMHLSSGLDVN